MPTFLITPHKLLRCVQGGWKKYKLYYVFTKWWFNDDLPWLESEKHHLKQRQNQTHQKLHKITILAILCDLFGMVIRDPFQWLYKWPPTFGDEKVTAWITWMMLTSGESPRSFSEPTKSPQPHPVGRTRYQPAWATKSGVCFPNSSNVWRNYLHENHKFKPNVGKYSTHGAFGLWYAAQFR